MSKVFKRRSHKVIKNGILFFSLYLFPFLVQSQDYIEMGSKHIQNFSYQDYKANPQNWDIAQNKEGLIYFGNSDGLLEYDGNTWRMYSVSNFSIVYSLAIGNDNRIYVGAQNEFGFFQSDSIGNLTYQSLVNFVSENDQDFSNVWQTVVTEDKVYYRSSYVIFVWDIKSEKMETIRSELGFHKIFDLNDVLYIREEEKGLQEIKNNRLEPIKGGDLFAKDRVYIMHPFPARKNTYLIGARKQGLFIYDGKSFEPFKTELKSYFLKNAINTGVVLSDDTFFLGTTNAGAIIIDTLGRQVRSYTVKNGISNNSILNTFKDKDGAIWLATENGISRIDYSSPFTYYESDLGLKIYDCIRHKGVLYFSDYSGVYVLNPINSQFGKIKNSDIGPWAFTEIDDDLLVGTQLGLYVLENNSLNPIVATQETEHDITYLKRSKLEPSRIFIGSTNGLWSVRKNGKTWINEGKIVDFSDQVTTIAEDAKGSVWVATYSLGVYKVNFTINKEGKIDLSKPEITQLGENDGFDSGLTDVYSIGDKIYILTAANLYTLDKNEKRFVTDTTDQVISAYSNYVNNSGTGVFQQDADGNIWLGDKNAVVHSKILNSETIQWGNVPLNRFVEDGVFKIYKEQNGSVWISKVNTIVKYEEDEKSDKSYSALIRNVNIGEDSTIYYGAKNDKLKAFQIDYEHNSLSFRYSATSFEENKSTRFKTLLQGFDERESAWSYETKREFTNLSPGKYTFFVRAINLSNVESSTDRFTFEILPPWYRTWWAYLFYALIFGFFLNAVIHNQNRRVLLKEREKAENDRKAAALEHAKEIEKAYRDLEKSHKELKATQNQLIHAEKMASLGELTAGIAHEIQNPLNFVNNFAELSSELLDEMKEEIEKGDLEEVKFISEDVKKNLVKNVPNPL